MITTKQRAMLRSLANVLEPVMQIGKESISENGLQQINGLLEARELIKIKVLKNCDSSAKQIAKEISVFTKCEVIQVIGSKIVLYRFSTKKDIKHIELI